MWLLYESGLSFILMYTFLSNFYNSLFEIQFMQHKIYPVTVYNSLVFSVFTDVYTYQHYLILEHF